MYIYISSCWNWKRTGNDVPWKKNKHYDVCFSDQYKKNDFTNRRYILQNMEKSLGEFFTILNLDCIFYSLTILPDSHVDIKWDRLAPRTMRHHPPAQTGSTYGSTRRRTRNRDNIFWMPTNILGRWNGGGSALVVAPTTR